MSQFSHIFAINEMTSLIFTFLEDPNLAKILTVSRNFFDCAAPIIWKDISEADELWSLISDLNVEEFLDLQRRGSENQSPLNRVRLSRFHVYAPFIRKFEITMRPKWIDPTWATLLDIIPTRPILPHLHTLVLFIAWDYTSSDLVEYIGAFLNPSLVHISSKIGWLNPFLASRLLDKTTRTCPDVHTLDLFPGNHRYPDEILPFSPCPSPSLFSGVSILRGLRRFTGSCAMLHPEMLPILGGLPRLESFTVYGLPKRHEQIQVYDLPLPEHSFASLEHLGAHCLPLQQVSALWHLPPLVQRISSVFIDLDSDPMDVASISDLIRTICEKSPRITDWQMNLMPNVFNPYVLQLPSAIADHLKRLSLRILYIKNAVLSGLSPGFGPLAYAFRDVEFLHMQDQRFRFPDLVLVARCIPRLQFLVIGLLIYEWLESLDITTEHPSTSKLCLKAEFEFEDDFEGQDDIDACLSILAHGFINLWPNGVRCMNTSAVGGMTPNEVDMQRLNDMIAEKTGVVEFDAIPSAGCATNWREGN